MLFSNLKNFGVKGVAPSPLLNILRQRTSMLSGNIPMACFAKYDRNKPHLNVGTIGK